MKFLTAVFMAAMLLIPSVARASVSSQSIARAEQSTVIVFGNIYEVYTDPLVVALTGKHDDTLENVPYCSGVLVARDDNYDAIATAGHCDHKITEQGDEIFPTPLSVKYNDGTHYPVLGYGHAANDDIGILIVAKTHRQVTKISASGVKRGADYFAFSMPNGYAWSFVPATSMQGDKYSNAMDPWKFTNLMTCPGCGPGDSGGGMFDADGNLVGITVAGDGNYALIVPAKRILTILGGPIIEDSL